MSLTSTSTIGEINAALDAGTATHEEAVAILTPRSLRDSASGRRARNWLASHPLTEPVKPVRKVGPGSRGGDPKNYARGLYATYMTGETGTPAWWAARNSDLTKALCVHITTHEQAKLEMEALFA
jgi:hypothetical protein